MAKNETASKGWWPPKGVAAAAFWLAICFGVIWVTREVRGTVRGPMSPLLGLAEILVGVALGVLVLVLLARLVRKHLLWSLRNKLVLTYLLFALAPVVLFVTLVAISAYVAAGQFAIHLADSRLRAELIQMDSENTQRTRGMARYMEGHNYALPGGPPAGPQQAAQRAQEALTPEIEDVPRSTLQPATAAYLNGTRLQFGGGGGKAPFGLPPWAGELPGQEFQGLVLDGDGLYLVVLRQHRFYDGQVFTMESSLPVDTTVMEMLASGLGLARLMPVGLNRVMEEQNSRRAADASVGGKARAVETRPRRGPAWISGGVEPSGSGTADVRVSFLSSLEVTDWETGKKDNSDIEVVSRPSLLYKQLFGTSLGGWFTNLYRWALLILCAVFALVELLALWMAIRLSKTITASVADLYEATQKIDRGELNHRIGVERDDQLAELSKSFNTMTGSLQRLLLEQKEKERMQNELTIAQEVQANLFPHEDCDLERLKLHGVCRPARSVSGDYYDFLLFHEEAYEGRPGREVTGVGIAQGDISGKGISAALLMATLHSAVRAYQFASEELVHSGAQMAGMAAGRDDCRKEQDELFQSPGRILALLNRHLYRSTQPEKYATLFLAHYEAKSAMLTYSNAGQLPPLVLSLDGSVRRLDRGGTVVGLLDGVHYEEDRFQMKVGDILVAYSDGVTEPENEFGEFGEDRLMEVVRQHSDQPLHVISAEVMRALDAWIGDAEQPDDITLVLARQL